MPSTTPEPDDDDLFADVQDLAAATQSGDIEAAGEIADKYED